MMEMDYNLKSLAKLFKLFLCILKKIDIYSRSWVNVISSFRCSKIMFFMGKLDFRTVKTKNLQNPCDRAPLNPFLVKYFEPLNKDLNACMLLLSSKYKFSLLRPSLCQQLMLVLCFYPVIET